MKRIFTLAALLITMVSFAAPTVRGGRIIISNNDNSLISVRLNGRMYNVNQQTIFLENLPGGKHKLEVYKTERRGFSNSRPVLIFSQAVYVDPSYILDLFINRYGEVNLKKNMTVRSNGNRYDDRYDDRAVIRYDARNGGAMNPQYDNDRRNDNRYNDNSDSRNNGRNDNQYNDRNSNDVRQGSADNGKPANSDQGNRGGQPGPGSRPRP